MSNTTNPVEPATDEKKREKQRLIEKAKAEGNPWANMIGIFPDDKVTRIWIKEMKAVRQWAEEDNQNE